MQTKIDFYFKSEDWSENDIMKEKRRFSEIVLKTLEIVDAINLCKILNFDIVFISDAMMENYNLKFRNKSQATNVLAFPAEKFSKADLKKFKMEYLYLGEIIFSFETIKRESNQQKKIFKDHLLHLFVHAFLHLLGYEHDNDNDRIEMERLEILILKHFGIKNPYEANL